MIDWTAVGALAAVLGLPLAYHVGTRRRSARIYAEPMTSGYCRVVIENNSETPVTVSRVAGLWPRSLRVGLTLYGAGSTQWLAGQRLETQWQKSISVAESVAPGKTGYLDFELRSKNRSSLISLIVDESRPTQINRIRVIKVLQMPATDSQRPSMSMIG